ncbi:hypothetical protein R1sor_012820 [Riccia sorocarpa]|uniref:Uncharacterized protein n=1 Tax=Riccia sorocarpa TaxID=122646 RepID=A0ABD3I880_9MARC
MKTFSVNLHQFELRIRSSSLKRRESIELHMALNLAASSASLRIRRVKLQMPLNSIASTASSLGMLRVNLQLTSTLLLRPLPSGAPSCELSLGAFYRKISNKGNNIERKTFEKSIQMLQAKAEVALEEEAVLVAFRDALKVDHFTASSYDTAWVAMIPNDNNDGPLYPQSLYWLSCNQRQDGSWGDESSVCLFDSVLSTLACVVALRTWNTSSSCIRKGEKFLQEALSEMEEDDLKMISPGVFHALAELLEEALRLGISLPYSSSMVKHFRINHGLLIDSLRGYTDVIKLCPKRLLSFPESLRSVIPWNKCAEIQSAEGDLFLSPAATACLVIETGDINALAYLKRLLKQFGSAVPSMYPKQPQQLLSLVNHLEGLNVDRFFHKEIHELLRTLSRLWKLECNDQIEDAKPLTESMKSKIIIFRALREHGFTVLPENSVFAKFFSGDTEMLEADSILNTYRASELKFPGDEMLEYAKNRSASCLTALVRDAPEHVHSNLIEETKDALGFPSFLKNRPVESMSYIDRFEFTDYMQESYAERSFSRITHAGNPRLLAFAKKNFNKCQAAYQEELQILARWEEGHKLNEVPFIRHPLYPAYLTAVDLAAPEFFLARQCWTMNSVLTTAVDDLFDRASVPSDLSELRLFLHSRAPFFYMWDLSEVEHCNESIKIIARCVVNSVDYLIEEVNKVQGRDLGPFFRRMWVESVVAMMTEAEWAVSGYKPNLDEYIETGYLSLILGPIVPLSVFFLDEIIYDEVLESQEYWDLFRTVSTFGRLVNDSRTHERDTESGYVSAVSLYVQQHPELTVEQSKAIVDDMVEQYASEALSKLLNPNYACPAVRSGWLSMMRALYMMYYRNVDGYSITPKDLKKKMKRFFFQPYPADEV